MGWTWEVQLWCIMDLVDGLEDWGWEHVYKGNSWFQALKIARRKKKETGNAVRIIWR